LPTVKNKLSCVQGEHKPTRSCRDLDLKPTTLKLDRDLDILKAHPHAKSKVPWSSQVIAETEKSTKIALNVKGQGQIPPTSRFQPLLAFTGIHIPTKLRQFLTSSLGDFLWTVTQRDAQTDRQTDATNSNSCSQHRWSTAKKYSCF